MEIQELEVFIGQDGKVSYEVKGVKGKKCLDITKGIELDLGGEIISREEKSEMYEQETQEQTRQKIKHKE